MASSNTGVIQSDILREMQIYKKRKGTNVNLINLNALTFIFNSLQIPKIGYTISVCHLNWLLIDCRNRTEILSHGNDCIFHLCLLGAHTKHIWMC